MNRCFLVVPRVLFEAWSGQDYMDFFSVDQEQLALAQTLIQTCRKYKFDGFVIEIWLQFGGRVQSSLMIHLVRQIGRQQTYPQSANSPRRF